MLQQQNQQPLQQNFAMFVTPFDLTANIKIIITPHNTLPTVHITTKGIRGVRFAAHQLRGATCSKGCARSLGGFMGSGKFRTSISVPGGVEAIVRGAVALWCTGPCINTQNQWQHRQSTAATTTSYSSNSKIFH